MTHRRFLIMNCLGALLFLAATSAQAHEPPGGPSFALYDSDPAHLWNQLHRALFMRVSASGDFYGHDDHELLYWSGGIETRHLLDGETARVAMGTLDEFIEKHAERLIGDPLKRAMLQHDLWSLFDWSAEINRVVPEDRVPLAEIQKKLATVMKRIALTAVEIESLPDNYVLAVASGSYPRSYDPDTRAVFLPADFFDEWTGWVRVFGSGGEQGARSHVEHADGHSQFWVFIRLPGDPGVTKAYVDSLRDLSRPYEMAGPDDTFVLNGRVSRSDDFPSLAGRRLRETELPEFPVGTAVALVEQMMLIDRDGEIAPASMVKNVQLRVYREVERGGKDSFDPFEFRLSRRALFQNDRGGLLPLRQTDVRFMNFGTHGFDPLQGDTARRGQAALSFCNSCHGSPGVSSFLSRDRILGFPGQFLPMQYRGHDPAPAGLEVEWQAAIDWKTRRYSWGLLEGLWRSAR